MFSERLTAAVEVLEVKKEEEKDDSHIEAHIDAHEDVKSEIKLEVEDKKRRLAAEEVTQTPVSKRRRKVLSSI